MKKLIAGQAAKQFRRLGDTGLKRGAGGNGVWLGIWLVVGGIRLMSRLGARKREVVFRRVLEPGETLNIAHLLEDMKGRPTS